MRQIAFFWVLFFSIIKWYNAWPQSTDITHYNGTYFSGTGDIEYTALLDSASMMMYPNSRIENLSMLYKPDWNGFVEGPTWNAWWIQNSFGPTYSMLPFMDKAYQTFIFNSQDLWFRMQGNGVRKGINGYVGPKGALCDAATPNGAYYRQGDGKVDKHDWGFGFTAAGMILQSELLLIRRDKAEIEHYLPLLEASAEFIDSRRDPVKNTFLVGAAGNLLAPSYAGTGKQLPDGSYEKAYLAEISVNYIAALDRLIELEKMMGRDDKVSQYTQRRELVREGLSSFITPEGYFIRSIGQDGTKHGIYGASVHGYFESIPNHDAMAFRVADDQQARMIYNKINSIPQLRPYQLIIPNFPSYDDMYEAGGLFTYGRWINGGEWTTCEARMQIGYYRVGAHEDAKQAFMRILKRALDFRLDNNLTEFGSKEYQPHLPINCVYDCWGAPGGFLRGLFEYVYMADGLRLFPHIPSGVKSLQQKFPVYFGGKKIYMSTSGSGDITSVKVNGKPIKDFDGQSVFLKLDDKPGEITVSIGLGTSPAPAIPLPAEVRLQRVTPDDDFWNVGSLQDVPDTLSVVADNRIKDMKRIFDFYNRLTAKKLAGTYEGEHAALILSCIQSIDERRKLKRQNKLALLPLRSQKAADDLYITTTIRLTDGLIAHLNDCMRSEDESERTMARVWADVCKSMPDSR